MDAPRHGLDRRPGRAHALIAQPAARGQLALDRDDPRRLLGMPPGVVLQRGGCCEEHRGGGHRGVPYLPRARRETQVAVVGAGAAGLYTALCARAAQGARVTLVSATPLAESSSYWAQGGLAAALAADDSPERHLRRHARRRPRHACASPRPASCATRRQPRSRRSTALGVHFDADRDGQLALGLEGGHSRPAGRPRRRRRHRAAGSSASSRRSSPRTSGSRSSSGRRVDRVPHRRRPLAAACGSTDGDA